MRQLRHTVNCLAELKAKRGGLSEQVMVQVAEGSFSHVASTAAFAPSIPYRRICTL